MVHHHEPDEFLSRTDIPLGTPPCSTAHSDALQRIKTLIDESRANYDEWSYEDMIALRSKIYEVAYNALNGVGR